MSQKNDCSVTVQLSVIPEKSWRNFCKLDPRFSSSVTWRRNFSWGYKYRLGREVRVAGGDHGHLGHFFLSLNLSFGGHVQAWSHMNQFHLRIECCHVSTQLYGSIGQIIHSLWRASQIATMQWPHLVPAG